MDAILFIRLFYLGVALAAILISLAPPLRRRFLAYGPRALPFSPSSAEKEKQSADKDQGKENVVSNAMSRALDTVAQCTVPHDYFWTFYFLCTSLSAFWFGEIIFLRGDFYQAIADRTDPRGTFMSFEQLKITWVMLLVQGLRRLHECLNLSPPSDADDDKKRSPSQMWIGFWVLGVLFYTFLNVAIWIEGIPTLEAHHPTVHDLAFRSPSLRTIISILLFILASGMQYDCHAYLANLKHSKPEEGQKVVGQYQLPTHPAFHSLIAPHYTAECAIYLAFAMVATPQGQWINWTLASVLVFTIVVLGITAKGTYQWYEQKFGPEAVKDKWILLPFVY